MCLFRSDKNSGYYGNLKFQLTYKVEKWKLPIFAVSLEVFVFFTDMFIE